MKAEDRASSPAPGSDFNRTSEDATHEHLVVLFATQYGLMATPEETEAMLLRAYGPDRLPGTESRRRSNLGKSPREPEPHGACEMCGEPLTWGVRFCSQACFSDYQRTPPSEMTSEEVHAEMLAALENVRTFYAEHYPEQGDG